VTLPHLRAWREAKHLTQAQLAERAGVRHLENVERGANMTTVPKLAEALNVTPN
jgi:transcriptional regulator with XRE-family HTH domain